MSAPIFVSGKLRESLLQKLKASSLADRHCPNTRSSVSMRYTKHGEART